jgi:hypothetical protein
VPDRVPPRDLERVSRDVRGDDGGRRALVRDRDRHAAAAGADIGHRQRRGPVAIELQHRFDNQLGRRARDQHLRRHLQLEAPELPHADDVGERLSGGASRDERLVPRREVVRLARVRVREETLGGPAEHMLREESCVEI